METVRLLAAIVNYRTPALTLEALAALVPELECLDHGRARVVDNDSRDGSYEELSKAVSERGWTRWVSVVESGRNGGMGFGLNFALRPALAAPEPPDYFYLLNSDAFPAAGALTALVEFLERHPDAGIAGSYIHGPEGEPHSTAFRFPSIAGEIVGNARTALLRPLIGHREIRLPLPTRPAPVDWLAGASMLVRRDVFEAIGLFDEEFFLYYEETDLCLRARRAGWSTWYVPESRVAHVGGASTRFKDLSRPRAPYWFESRRRYFRKHHGSAYLALANAVWVGSFCFGTLRDRLARRPCIHPPRLLRDFLRHNFRLRGRSRRS